MAPMLPICESRTARSKSPVDTVSRTCQPDESSTTSCSCGSITAFTSSRTLGESLTSKTVGTRPRIGDPASRIGEAKWG